MNYNFNKKLIEQVKAGTTIVFYDPAIHSINMLHALSKEAWPTKSLPEPTQITYFITVGGKKGWFACNQKYAEQNDLFKDYTIIPLSNFVQPEQSERDVMADLDERLKRLEDILLRDNEPCKAEPVEAEPINPVRWRAEVGGLFYFVTSMLDITTLSECFDTVSTVMYNRGNYFQTTQQAEEMAVLMQFTLNNPELVKQLMTKKE